MSKALHTYIFLFIQVVTLCQAVYAADAAELARQMPRSYEGEFQGRGSARISRVTINFTDVRALDNAQVEAVGTGVYDVHGEFINVNVRAVINSTDLYLEIWEYETGSTDAEGIYRGDLSADMQSITAMWTSFADKRRGNLTLTANP